MTATSDHLADQDRSRAKRRHRVVHAYLRLPHAVPVVAVLTCTVAFAVVAADGVPPTGTLAAVILAMLGGQIVVGVVNELVDAGTDASVKPSKPIPAGDVTIRGAQILATMSMVVMVGFSARLGWASLVLCTLGTGVGIAYSLWFKRSLYAWLPYLLALPLLPIWVFVAVAEFDARLLILYPLGSFAGIAVHLAQSLPDVAADRASGVRNLTSTLGESRAFVLCQVSLWTSLAIAVVAAAFWIDTPTIVFAAAAIVVAIALGNVVIYWRRRRAGILACFPCVAASTAVLGFAWVVATTR